MDHDQQHCRPGANGPLQLESNVRCHLCYKEIAPPLASVLSCNHRFCSNCASVEGTLCVLCTRAAWGVAPSLCDSVSSSRALSSSSATPSNSDLTSSSLFDALSSTDSLPVESAFRIWQQPPAIPAASPLFNQLHRAPPHSKCVSPPTAFSPPHDSPSPSLPSFPCSAVSSPPAIPQWPPPCSSCCAELHSATIATVSSQRPLAISRCDECCEFLCADCVHAHRRVRLTRDHCVRPIRVVAPVGSLNAASPDLSSLNLLSSHSALPLSSSPSLAFPPTVTNVLNHLVGCGHDAQHPPIACCHSCDGQPLLCVLCLPEHPVTHILRHPVGVEMKSSIAVLASEVRRREKAVDEGREGVRRMTERVEASVQAVVSELRSVIHQLTSALEERKRDLLQRIDIIRHAKVSVLSAQFDQLSRDHLTMRRALDTMESAIGVAPSSQDALLSAFEALIRIAQQPPVECMPHDTDHLRFLSPASDIIQLVKDVGGIESGPCAEKSHIEGGARAIRQVVRGRTATVTVSVRNACGDPAKGEGAIRAEISDPEGGDVDACIEEKNTGTYTVSFRPVIDGSYKLAVTIRSLQIGNSPMTFLARKGRNYSHLMLAPPVLTFGTEGQGDGQLCRPWGITCDRRGRILVADRSNNRIQMFNANGEFLLKWGTGGSRPGEFNRPAGLAVNTRNDVIVADKDNHRVQIFDEDGGFLLVFGSRGRGNGAFNYPWGVACSAMNEIAISDTRNHRIQLFSHDGQFLRKFGFENSYFHKHLDSPRGVCFMPGGQLLVSDFNNHRLAVFLHGDGHSDTFHFYGSEGDGHNQFCRPQGVAVDAEGNVLVCDSKNNRIQVLNSDEMQCIGVIGVAPGGTHLLDRPTDICIGPDGRIFVVDFGHNCIHVY